MERAERGIAWFRTGRVPLWLGLLAMAMQLLFAAEHASALAVSAARGGADGPPPGFLQICPAEGLVSIAPEPGRTNPDGSRNAAGCVVCGPSCVPGAMEAPGAADIPPIAITALDIADGPADDLVRAKARPSERHARAPPRPSPGASSFETEMPKSV